MELRLAGRRELLHPGAHPCQLYTLEEDAVAFAAVFLAAGIRGGYAMSFAGPEPRAEAIAQALAAQSGGDVADRFEHIASRSDLLLEDQFDPYHLISFQQSMVDRALANGRAGVCFVLDMTWLASGTSSAAQVMKYEAVAESVFSYQERPLVTLVQYHHTRAMEYLAVELLRIHAMSIVGHIMRRNPQHVDAEEYLRRFIRPKRQPNAPATAPLPLTPESRAGRLRLGRGPRLF